MTGCEESIDRLVARPSHIDHACVRQARVDDDAVAAVAAVGGQLDACEQI